MGVGGPGEPTGAGPGEPGQPRRDAPVSRKRRREAPLPREQRPIPEPLSRRSLAIFAAVVGILYASGMIARGAVAPGLVGGTLAAILCFLVFREVGNRQRRRIEERERRRG